MIVGWLIGLSVAQAETTIRVDSLAVDGLHVQSLQCSLSQGGLLASAMVVGALAAEKSALDACSPSGNAFSIAWHWSGGTEINTIEGGTPAEQQCIRQTMGSILPPTQGNCSATLLVGELSAAQTAAEQLHAAHAAQ